MKIKLNSKIIICYFFLMSNLIAHAQLKDESLAVQGMALGNQNAVIVSPFSALGNPALMVENKKTSLGFTVNNRFFIRNLKLGGFGATHRFTKTDFLGIAFQFDGTSNLKQNTIGIAYAKKVNEKFYAGISIIYINLFERTIASKNKIIGKAGMCYQPTKQFLIGATVYNPFAAKLTILTTERIPTIISAGVCYKVSKQVKVYAEYKLGWYAERILKLGLSYEPRTNIIVYAGFQNSGSPLSLGLTIKTRNININIASQYHQILGFSPIVGFEMEKE